MPKGTWLAIPLPKQSPRPSLRIAQVSVQPAETPGRKLQSGGLIAPVSRPQQTSSPVLRRAQL